MQQRFELRGHHQVDQKDRQAEREQQRLHRLRQLLALPADMHAHAGSERVLTHHRFHFAHRTAQVDVLQAGRHDRHAGLIGAVDLARPRRRQYLGNGRQTHRPAAARVDDQLTNRIDTGAVALLRAHQHIDLAVAEAVARGHIAAHLLDDDIGNLTCGQPQRTGALLIETDLDFREALFHRRFDVGVVAVGTQHRGQLLHGAFQLAQILTAQFHFQRRRKTEQRRPLEIHLRARVPDHAAAQPLGRCRFHCRAATTGHHHGELADVFAALGGVGIQPRAATADAVQ